MNRPSDNPAGIWAAVGIGMTVLTLYLLAFLRSSGMSTVVQLTVILSLIPVLVFVD